MNNATHSKPGKKTMHPFAGRALGIISLIGGIILMLGFIIPFIGAAFAIIGVFLFFIGIALVASSSPVSGRP